MWPGATPSLLCSEGKWLPGDTLGRMSPPGGAGAPSTAPAQPKFRPVPLLGVEGLKARALCQPGCCAPGSAQQSALCQGMDVWPPSTAQRCCHHPRDSLEVQQPPAPHGKSPGRGTASVSVTAPGAAASAQPPDPGEISSRRKRKGKPQPASRNNRFVFQQGNPVWDRS